MIKKGMKLKNFKICKIKFAGKLIVCEKGCLLSHVVIHETLQLKYFSFSF